VEAEATVVIPDLLATGGVTFKDDPVAGTFTASFLVTGGTKPYTLSKGQVEDDKVTIEGLTGGTTEVLIQDSQGWQSTVTISHEVQTTDKPCGGAATRSRYPTWAPRPAPKSSYKYRTLKTWKLSVAEDSKPIFSEDFGASIMGVVNSDNITAAKHDAVMASICDLVSKGVAAKTENALGERAFVVEYDSQRGTLLIESYSCHTFQIEIDYEIELGGKVLKERWVYDRGAVRVSQESAGESASYSMPTFGVITMDKLNETAGTDCSVKLTGLTPKKVLTGGVRLVPSFGQAVNANQLTYHWRIDSPSLAYSEQPNVIVTAKAAFRVQLLVIDQKACWAFLETWLTPTGTTPGGRVRGVTTRSRKTPSRTRKQR
jgi:hypothetical protein